MEKDSYALFIDNSGSVGGSENYWGAVQTVINKYAKDISHYYLWNSQHNKSSLKEIEGWIKSRKGTGGTNPSLVAIEVIKQKFKNIILVTDGEVGDANVQACDQSFANAEKKDGFKIDKSICILASSTYGELNMSVTCPFSRNCESQVWTKKKGEELKALVQYTAQDYKILDSLEEITLDNFEEKYDLIEGLIIALNMGKEGNIPLKNQLVSMKTRLVKELSKKMTKEVNFGQEMREYLEKDNFEAAIEIAARMSKEYFSDSVTTDLEKKVSHLINLCGDLRGKYDIGQIKSNKMATAQTAIEGKLDKEVEVSDLSKNPIECPIILDEDVPQILIDECEPFLLNVEKHIVDDIAACPLRILNYPDLKAKFKSSLSTFTGVKYSDKLLKNPFTQNRLLGAIPLGTHKSHVAVGNFTIAKLIAGGKIMGNLNMYYAVIWYLINEGEIEFLNPIKENATEHLLFRMKNSSTMASMCGLAQFVTTQIPTDVAVWYCVSSGYLNQPTDRDTFRFHFPNLEPMIKIVKALKYPLDKGLKSHFLRTKTLMTMLSRFKKFTTHEKKEFKTWCRGFYQRGFFIDSTKVSEKFKELEVCPSFIPIDGEPEPDQVKNIYEKFPKYCLDIPVEELYHITTLLDAQKSASDIFLDYNIKVPPLPKAEINWCYGLKEDKSKVQFNPKTLRPFYTVEGRVWEEVALECFKVEKINQLFSGCKLMINYIEKYEKKPEPIEMMIFYYNRIVEGGKKKTLPFLTEIWTKELCEKFLKAAEAYNIQQTLEVIKKSQSIENRIKIEKE